MSDSNEPVITNEETLWRRLSDDGPNMITVDAGTGRRRPSSGTSHPDSDGVSVYRVRGLSDQGRGPEAIVTAPCNLVYTLAVRHVRCIEPLDVKADPLASPAPSVLGQAHALILGWSGLSRNERTRRQRPLAHVAVLASPRRLKPWRTAFRMRERGYSGFYRATARPIA